MNKVFPSISTVSIRETEAGSIVKISRHPAPILALVTDHLTNSVRSIVLLNVKSQDHPSVIFAANWRNEEGALRYNDDVRFELGTSDDEIDATGQRSWETPGIIVSIGNELFIRAAPQDIYSSYTLVNIRTGSVFLDRPPSYAWSFLSWKLAISDAAVGHDVNLMEFRFKKAEQ